MIFVLLAIVGPRVSPGPRSRCRSFGSESRPSPSVVRTSERLPGRSARPGPGPRLPALTIRVAA